MELVITEIGSNVNNAETFNNEKHLNLESFRMLKLPIKHYRNLQFQCHPTSFWNIYLRAFLPLTKFIHSGL